MSRLRQSMKTVMMKALPARLFLVRGPVRIVDGNIDPTLNQIASSPQVALTFNDGPHPEHTPRLLDYLAASATRATFFVVGECAQRHPHLIRRIADEGHELGNHTFTHGKPHRTNTTVFLDEVRRTRALLQDLTGDDCSLMRPPNGKLTVGKLWGLWSERQTVVLWNVDPRDHSIRSRKEIGRWCDSYAPHDGDIVLMHDNHPYASAAIENMSGRQDFEPIQFVRISDWLSGDADSVTDQRQAEYSVTN